jgi:hypothetical protein
MSDYQPKPGSGALFKNRHKEAGDNKPDYTGNGVDLNGQPFLIAAWVKRPEGKPPFMSFALSLPKEQQQAKPQQQRPLTQFAPEDDVPF